MWTSCGSSALIVFAFATLITVSIAAGTAVPLKSYSCSQDRRSCLLNSRGAVGLSHETCLMLCGNGNLWPYPSRSVRIGATYSLIGFTGISNFVFDHSTIQTVYALQHAAADAFFESVRTLHHGTSMVNTPSISIRISIDDPNVIHAAIDNDESYVLDISTDSLRNVIVQLHGETFFGVRHALETLSQLIVWDYFEDSLVIADDVHIEDSPSFSYRGVMVDLSRHFISMEKLKETIRGMGFNKLNVLHLHLSDTASFPAELLHQPNITSYGAYSNDHVYSHSELVELQAFANVRGVMVLPEIDTPAHVGAGWQWGPEAGLGELALCTEILGDDGPSWNTDALEPPSGQLNIANEAVYPILADLYRDMVDIFGASGYFHMGGDEVIVGSDDSNVACYNSSVRGKPILEKLEELGLSRQESSSFYFLWEEFTKRASNLIQSAYGGSTEANDTVSNDFSFKKLHIWGGGVSDDSECYNLMSQPNLLSVLPPDQVSIQVWDSSDESVAKTLIADGYDIILSNYDYVYLDCGNAGMTNPGGYWCQPYHEWYHIYQYVTDVQSKWSLTSEELSHIKGSETLIWTEMVDDSNIAQKLWPRSAALAEALWTFTAAPVATLTATPTLVTDVSAVPASSQGKYGLQGIRSDGIGSNAAPGGGSSGWYAAEPRMQQWRNLLVRRGVAAEALLPLWCQQRADHVCTLDQGTPQ